MLAVMSFALTNYILLSEVIMRLYSTVNTVFFTTFIKINGVTLVPPIKINKSAELIIHSTHHEQIKEGPPT